MAVMIPFRRVVLFKSSPEFDQLHRWTWIIAFASIQRQPQTYWTTRISNFAQSKCPFCFSLAWLDSILRWCVQFQAQMNLPAQAHLRKDVSRDWSAGIPGGRVVVQSEWEQFALCRLNQTFSDIYKKRNLHQQEKKTKKNNESDFLKDFGECLSFFLHTISDGKGYCLSCSHKHSHHRTST